MKQATVFSYVDTLWEKGQSHYYQLTRWSRRKSHSVWEEKPALDLTQHPNYMHRKIAPQVPDKTR